MKRTSQKKNTQKCTQDIRNIPPTRYQLPDDGRKVKQLCSERRTLLVQLATYASGDGTDVKPSIQTLADALGCNRRTIARRIIELRTLGFLEDGGLDGQFKTRIRSINVAKVIAPVTDSPKTPVSDSNSPVTDSQITCDRFEGNLRQIHQAPVTDRRSPVTDRRPNDPYRHIPSFSTVKSTVIVDREPDGENVVEVWDRTELEEPAGVSEEPTTSPATLPHDKELPACKCGGTVAWGDRFKQTNPICLSCGKPPTTVEPMAVEGECPECGDPCPAGQGCCDDCVQAENRRITIGEGKGHICPSCSALRGWSKWRHRTIPDSPPGTRLCPECDVAVIPREATPEEYGMALNGWTLEQLEGGEMIVKNETFNQFFQIDEETEDFVPSELPEPKGKRHMFDSQAGVMQFYKTFGQWETHELVLRLGLDGRYAVDAEPTQPATEAEEVPGE